MGGTVFGPKKFGAPSDTVAPTDRRLEDQAAFNRQPQVNAMMDAIYGSLGGQQAKAMAGSSKLGVGRSSGTSGQLANLAAGAERNVNEARYKAAFDTFKEQLAQKQFGEQMDMERYKQAEDKRRFSQGLNEAEDARRRSVLPFNIGRFLS